MTLYSITLGGYTPSPRYPPVTTPWTAAEIAYAPTSAGPFTPFDTITFPNPDADPSQPALRNLTTILAPAPSGWFQVTFVDAAGTEEPTEPVTSTGATAFATPDDLAARIARTFTSEQETRARTLLELASGLIRDEAKQTIDLVENDTLTLRGTTDETILLPQRPVVSIASLTLDGETLRQDGDWYLDGNVIARMPGVVFIADRLADALLLGPGFGTRNQKLEIVYTHGYATIPEAITTICADVVARVWTNPGDLVEERLGSWSARYLQRGTPTGLLLTPEEQRTLRRMFGRGGGSVTLTS